MNLWHELEAGPSVPNAIHVVVEVPKGSRNKYEYDKRTGAIRLDRVLYSSLHYPGDYGLIPQTYYEDGDPLDALVMVGEASFPACVIVARPIGLFKMVDKGQPDDKILCVPATDPIYRDVYDLPHIPQHFLAEVAHFFSVYKDLEGVHVKTVGWERAEKARERILHAVELYQQQYPPLSPTPQV
jgi:inorganic pyrophosphatase